MISSSRWNMFFIFKGFSSSLSLVYKKLISMFSYYYLVILRLILSLFVMYRFPYLYRPFFFRVFLICVVFSCFLSLFYSRVFTGWVKFFSSFVPVGTPLWICPLVCLAETISYIIRPFILIFRPFIKISLGCFGAAAVGRFCLSNLCWMSILIILFFYEVFVALVHWFIVTNILSFSVDH